MILEAGRGKLADVSARLINRTTGKRVDGFISWDTKEQEGTVYNPDIYTEFTISREQYKLLAHEYGGRNKLNEDIEHNRIKLVIVD